MATVNFITPCSRPENLPILKASIERAKSKGKHDVIWHICFDSNIVKDFIESNDWIKIYSAGTHKKNPGKGQINFVLTHFKLGLFDGFIYILDDDNIIPDDFLEYDYNKNEFLIYLFPQICETGVRQITPLIDRIDQAQILVDSSIQIFYPLEYNGDGQVIVELCKNYSYKEMGNFVYYNKIVL